MRNKTLRWKTIALCSIMFCLPKTPLAGQEYSGFIHRLGMEARPQYVFPTNPFLQGENERWKPIQTSFAAHLKYSFKFRPNTCADRIYGGAYQGIGVSLTTFGDKKQLGDPFSFYVFQGARIARFSPRVSLNYEWNFGLSAGWKPYDNYYNSYNGAVGSRMNAYINAGVYINWAFSRYFDLIVGGDFTHFSNGNTKFPNAGINTAGAKIGLVYNFNRTEEDLSKSLYQPVTTRFPRHISYDVVLFGSWRRKGVWVGEKQIASPNAYPVAGFNFAPMYNLGYKFRVGASLYQMLCRQIPSFIMIRFYNRFFIYILQSPVYKNNRNRTGLQYFSCIHTVGHDNDSICFHLYQHLNILHLFFCIIP